MGVLATLTSMDRRLAKLRDAGDLSPETRRTLEESLRTRMTYASNAIEGNRLTLGETQVVLEGLTVGGKPLRDHLEAVDHAEAWDYLLDLVHSAESLTAWTLRTLHELVVRRSRPEDAGRFRTVAVAISGSTWAPPAPAAVPAEVDALFRDWSQASGHPIAVAAAYHAHLMAIHPFTDGNGRTGRLMMNLWLMRNHYPPSLIEADLRPRYINAMEAAHLGDTEPAVLIVAEGVSRMLSIYENIHGIE